MRERFICVEKNELRQGTRTNQKESMGGGRREREREIEKKRKEKKRKKIHCDGFNDRLTMTRMK